MEHQRVSLSERTDLSSKTVHCCGQEGQSVDGAVLKPARIRQKIKRTRPFFRPAWSMSAQIRQKFRADTTYNPAIIIIS